MASLEISAAQNLMRVGLNEDSELNSLLSYYRNKLDDFARERLEWITKFDELKHDAELRHKLEWDNRHLKDRVEELEKALSHHKTALYDERQSYLKLLRENNELKLKQTNDGRRIQELLSAGESYEDEMVMCKDVRPEISNKFIVNDLNIHKHAVASGQERTKNAPASKQNTGSSLRTAKNPMNPMKQTSVPNDQQTMHELELINLKKMHDLETHNLSEQVATLREELDRLQNRYDEREEAQTQEYKNLLARHTDTEKKHNQLAQEYFGVRMRLSEDEQKNQEKAELLRVKNIFLAEKLKDSERKAERQTKAIEQLVQKRNNDFKQKCTPSPNSDKADMRKKEEHLSILKEQYERVQEIYLAKIKGLEEHLSKLNDRYNDLTRKSKRESESLRSQLKVMERRVEKEHLEKMRLEIQQLQQQQRKKQEEEEREEARRLEEVEEKKKRKTQQIRKAYDCMTKTKPARTKKPSPSKPRPADREPSSDEEQESMNSSDIENIKKHIRELEAKLELDKQK